MYKQKTYTNIIDSVDDLSDDCDSGLKHDIQHKLSYI